MDYRFPDDPSRISKDALKRLDEETPPGTYLCQKKLDGWRRPAWFHEDGTITYHSKRNHGEEAAIQPPEELRRELEGMGWPRGIALDMEWMGPRLKDVLRGENHFYIFDLLCHDGRFLEDIPPAQRHATLKTLFEMLKAASKTPTDRIHLVEMVDRDLWKFFEQEQENPLAEGIVLRHAESSLVGDRWETKKNRLWLKCKWRDIKEPTVL
jgi:ATP-dependent DNA ligase